MKRVSILFTILTLIAFNGQSQNAAKSFYDFEVKDINGDKYDMSQLKGKKVMVVNVASKCGLTPQYEQLQQLHEEFGAKGFVIIGFPANNFMGQEPGSEKEIQTFCTENYGVTFQMMSKISVKGDDIDPLYKWLTTKEENKFEDSKVSWNFQKYLISKEGKIEKVISPKTKPYDPEIIKWIKG